MKTYGLSRVTIAVLIIIFSRSECCATVDYDWTLVDANFELHSLYLLKTGYLEVTDTTIKASERVYKLTDKTSTVYQLVIPVSACATGSGVFDAYDTDGKLFMSIQVIANSGQVLSGILRKVCSSYYRNPIHPLLEY